MAQQANFNFDMYNNILKSANTGLKLHLGIQLIKDVVNSLEYFDNPLEVELRPIYMDLKEFHQVYKAEAKKISERHTNDAEAANAGGRTQIDLDQLNTMQAQILALTKALDQKAA